MWSEGKKTLDISILTALKREGCHRYPIYDVCKTSEAKIVLFYWSKRRMFYVIEVSKQSVKAEIYTGFLVFLCFY